MTDEQRTEMSSNPSQPAHIFRFVVSHRKDRMMPLALAKQSCTPVAPACRQRHRKRPPATAYKHRTGGGWISSGPTVFGISARPSLSSSVQLHLRARGIIPRSHSAGIRHDLDAHQEDQGTARERLHYGGKDRS